jgi:hypothetical protein
MKKLIIVFIILCCSRFVNGQSLRQNTVFNFHQGYLNYDVDISDTIPLLYRFTEKDTIINDTIGAIKYLINENQRLYDLIHEQSKRLTEISLTISSLMLYIPKRSYYFEL